jgi:NCAIR mutase (PurE)-related protein
MRPFDHLREQLTDQDDGHSEGAVRGDTARTARTGGPEVIYAARKSLDQILAGIESLLPATGRVVISQLPADLHEPLVAALDDDLQFSIRPVERSGLVYRSGTTVEPTGARVAVLTAGTSDIPVAAEAALIATETGCEVRTTWDVGVAGIHRLVRPLESMIEWEPDAFVVAAGMDGILPTIVTGLVRQPVIGLPTSTGYGFGGEGLGALTTMLQSCAPGMAVVNIDNGIGAGVMAARIANAAARARQGQT